MACKCKKHRIETASHLPIDERTDYTTLPDEPCDICAEKHFSLAKRLMQEHGYVPVNRQDIIGELTAAAWHTFSSHRTIAEKLRDLRHKIQLRKTPSLDEWNDLCRDFENLLKFKVGQYLCSGEIFPEFRDTVWIVSNCEYEPTALVPAAPDDLIVFLNRAQSLRWYQWHDHKVVFHRSPDESYGTDEDKSAEHLFCFQGKVKNAPHIPVETIKEIRSTYNWDYEIEEGKVKSPTTGYLVINHIAKVLPNSKIKLVNFGFEVKKSTYRCPWHNWEFEAKELEKYTHFYTAEVAE